MRIIKITTIKFEEKRKYNKKWTLGGWDCLLASLFDGLLLLRSQIHAKMIAYMCLMPCSTADYLSYLLWRLCDEKFIQNQHFVSKFIPM